MKIYLTSPQKKLYFWSKTCKIYNNMFNVVSREKRLKHNTMIFISTTIHIFLDKLKKFKCLRNCCNFISQTMHILYTKT